MINLLLAIKFVHVLSAAVMYGAWLGVAGFMLLAHRARNPSVVALVAQFAVRIELFVVAGAIAMQPIAGFPLAWAIGLNLLNEFWLYASLALYVAIVAVWLVVVRVEIRLRNITREAALKRVPLPEAYARMFGIWFMLAAVLVSGMTVLMLLMVWQPRLE